MTVELHQEWMSLPDRLRQMVGFHREQTADGYDHPKFGRQSMTTMLDEMEKAADRIEALERALMPLALVTSVHIDQAAVDEAAQLLKAR